MQSLFDKISINRSFIMGIAIIWIVLHHCTLLYSFLPQYIRFPFFTIGYGGVDVFIFVSGFGVYHSLSQNYDIYEFLKRRILRLLPALPFIILYLLTINQTTFHTALGYITLQNFWISGSNIFYGYLFYLFLFYILSGLFFDIISKHLTNIRIQILFLCFLFFLTIPWWGTEQLVGVSRVLIFVLGMYFAYYRLNHYKISKKSVYFLYGSMITSFIALILIFNLFKNIRAAYGLAWYPFLFFVPGFVIICVYISEYLSKNKILKVITCIIDFLGMHSLEIYLVNYYITRIYIDSLSVINYFIYSFGLALIYIFCIKVFKILIKRLIWKAN